MCRDLNRRAIEQAVRAFALVLQAGNVGVVVFDVAEAPADAVRGLPFTTWMRLQRLLEGSQTAGVLVGTQPMARSASGLTLKFPCQIPPSQSRIRFRGRLFDGLDVEAQVVRARSHAYQETSAVFATVAAYGGCTQSSPGDRDS